MYWIQQFSYVWRELSNHVLVAVFWQASHSGAVPSVLVQPELIFHTQLTTTHYYTQKHTTTHNNAHYQIMSKVDWSGRAVDIIGIGIGDCGHSCMEQLLLTLMSLLGLSRRKLWFRERLRWWFPFIWVTDSINRCLVVFCLNFWFHCHTPWMAFLGRWRRCLANVRDHEENYSTIMDIVWQHFSLWSQSFDCFVDADQCGDH